MARRICRTRSLCVLLLSGLVSKSVRPTCTQENRILNLCVTELRHGSRSQSPCLPLWLRCLLSVSSGTQTWGHSDFDSFGLIRSNLMSTYRCCIWKLCWAFLLVVDLPRTHAAIPPHPRLILTPARITALKSEIATTRREFWLNALASADEFSRETVPEMRDANNRYRRFGDTMPA